MHSVTARRLRCEPPRKRRAEPDRGERARRGLQVVELVGLDIRIQRDDLRRVRYVVGEIGGDGAVGQVRQPNDSPSAVAQRETSGSGELSEEGREQASPPIRWNAGYTAGPSSVSKQGCGYLAAAIDVAEGAGRRGQRDRLETAARARGDVGGRPGGVEKSPLARVDRAEANAAGGRI